MTLKPSTPLATAQIAVAGSALMVVSYVLSWLPFASAPNSACISQALWVARYELLCVLLPGVLGTFLGWRYASFFGKGFRTEIWTDQQIECARVWIESRPVKYFQIILIVAFIVVAILTLSHHFGRHTHMPFAYVFIYALSPITSIRATLRRPLATAPRIDWSEVKPLHSSHWGDPSPSA